MIVVGIAGGIASGKSTVAQIFTRFGAKVIDGDQIGHEVLRQKDVIDAAVSRWGMEVIDEDGGVRRGAIARHVFGKSTAADRELAYWEGVMHPRIDEEIRKRIEAHRTSGQVPAVILDAAVMFKTGWHRQCNYLVFVDLPENLRRQRARERGWSDAEFENRERIQTPVEVKRQLADFVIDNSGTFDQTYEQVRAVWSLLSPGDDRSP